ncbi:hypothetical protein SUDANB6_03198 [Streptomyces sp. enrichment culture]|uniref:hypothetical protein n=1 Tax=Streptomyces sp. enrichment culture TaxID=1795815 RepID=UPI003F56EFE6
MNPRPRGRITVPAAAAVLLLTACGGPGAGDTSGKATASRETARTTRVTLAAPLLERPIDRARLLPSELAAIGRAEAITRAACMRRYGFDYRVEFTRSLHATVPDRSYGVMSADQARRYGYHMAPDVDPRVPANTRRQTDLVTSEEPVSAADRRIHDLLLYGTDSDRVTEEDVERADGPRPRREPEVIGEYRGEPVREGGCYEEARTEIVGDGGSERNPVAMRIYVDSFRRAERDPEVRRAVRAWSSCMAAEGYDYDSPLDAGTDLPTAREPRADAREKTVALADMACKDRTALIRVWSAAEARHERAAMKEESRALAAESERKAGMVRRALEVLSRTPGAAR